MKTLKFVGSVLITCACVSTSVVAQEEDRYDYCRDRARDLSGYFGAVPAEYENKGGLIDGAVKGAATGAALAWITGGDTSKSAERGAKLGALFGALKKASENKKRKDNAEKRRRYEIELHACMSARNSD